MDINDPYASDTLTAISDANARPRPAPPEPTPNWFMRDDNPVGTAAASIGKGVVSGGIATAGFWSDIVGAFGDVQAGYGAQADPALLVDPEARRKFAEQSADPAARVQSGAAFSSELGSALYGVSAGFNPNPATSNVVDRTLFGFSSTASRALGYSLAGGPLIGATLTAADVGSEAAQRLKEQGVDIGTRSAVGAVEGLGAGLGVVAPVAGSTVLRTAALVAGAGPGAYVAQTAATKAILENAGYDKIANQYDPFDPVGLAVSTAVPAFFGGLHMRGAARAAAAAPGTPAARPLTDLSGSELKAVPHADPRLDAYATQVEQQNGLPPGLLVAIKNAGERSNSEQVSSAGARGVMQFIDSTWNAYGRGDRTNPLNSIDAAGRYFPDLIKQYDGDVRAAVAAYNGGTKAGDAVHAGLQAPSKETRDYLTRVQQYLTDGGTQQLAGRRVPTPDEVDAARVAQNRDMIERTNLASPDDVQGLAENLAAFQRAQDQLGTGAPVEVSDALRPETLNYAAAMDDMIARMEEQHAELTATAGNAAERGDISAMRTQLDQLEQNPPNLDTITQNLTPRRTYEVTKTRAARESAQLTRDAQAEFESQTAAHQEQIARLRARIDENASADTARQQLQTLEPALQNLRNARAAIDAPATRRSAIADAVTAFSREAPEARIPNTDAAPRAPEAAAPEAAAEPRAAASDEASAAAPQAAAESATSGTTEQAAQSSAGDSAPSPESAPHLDAAIAELAAANPDAIVSVEINGELKDVPLSDALAAIQSEAAREKADAPLLDVAANCFLRTQEFQ
jgi:soluble lytic murein transglycosylase-like protein